MSFTRHPRFRTLVVGLAVAGGLGRPLAGQQVRGRLLDDATDDPVASATIQLLSGEEGESVVATGGTDAQGSFVLHASSPGTYRLRSVRIGYEAATTPPFTLTSGQVPLEVEVRISAAAVLLAPLTIVSERAPIERPMRLELVGYYERRDTWGPEGMGFGQFLEGEEIMSANPSRVSDVVRGLRGVRVRGMGGNRQMITLRGGCVPAVYVDGARAATGADIDELLSPSSLAAVEVYPGIARPGEFGAGRCGAIALWTGYRGLRDARPASRAATPGRKPAALTALVLDVELAADSVTTGASVWVTLTLRNGSSDTTRLCAADSRYRLRGSRTDYEIVQQLDDGGCTQFVELLPGGAHSWQERLDLPTIVDYQDTLLVQKRLVVRALACGDGEGCELLLRSSPRPLIVLP